MTDFEVLLTGRFGLEQVCVSWQPAAGRRSDPAIDGLIATTWERRVAVAAATGTALFAGPLCRLAAWEVAGDTFHLTFGPTDYRAYLGTNVGNLAAIQAAHPGDWHAYLADPVGVCAAIISADGWLLVVERGASVAEYAGWYGVVGGHPTPAHDDGAGGVSPFLALQDEILEETGIRPAEIAALTCLGLARNRANAKPELLFEARLALPRAAVDVRLTARTGPTEDTGHRWLNDDAAALHTFLAHAPGRVAPAGAACLSVYASRPSAGVGRP